MRRLKQDDVEPLPNGKNSLYLPEGSPEHCHYLAMWERRKKLDAVTAALDPGEGLNCGWQIALRFARPQLLEEKLPNDEGWLTEKTLNAGG